MNVVVDSVEKIVGKGENACYQHLLLFPYCFQKALNQSPIAELPFVIPYIHLCNGLNDKNLVKLRKACFLIV